MTLDELKQYRALHTEIADLEFRTHKEHCVCDAVQGSYLEPPYTLHAVSIRGVEDNPYTHEIARLKQSARDIEIYISSATDSLVRQAMRLKYMDGLEWKQVAQRIGGGNTEDSIKKQVYRYIRKN